ncbi:hypothetical protein [Pilimelia columellifera]|uniref:Uncharacterized protein n=1 Tax=Pilimelia columellifera subsp. columellifera TaxID=706583 RepID=A0ABN3NSR5_9ACTN
MANKPTPTDNTAVVRDVALDRLISPIDSLRRPIAMPGGAAQPAYAGRRRALAALAANIDDISRPKPDALLRPFPLPESSPVRGRATVPRMRKAEPFTVDHLGIWATRDRQPVMSPIIWEELSAAHPDLVEALAQFDGDDRGDGAATVAA